MDANLIEQVVRDTRDLTSFARQILAATDKQNKRIDKQKLYLAYILEYAAGTAESIVILTKAGKSRDAIQLARTLFELRIDAHFIYATNKHIWTDVLVAYNELETLSAIKINVAYENGVETPAETERIRSAKTYLSWMYKQSNTLPVVANIKEGKNTILAYNEATDSYKKGGTRFTIEAKCQLIDATILQDDEPGRQAYANYRTIYKYFSQFTHSSLLGMTEYRNGVSKQEYVSELDLKTEFKFVFYYLYSITKLAQDKLSVVSLPPANKKFKVALECIHYGDIFEDVT